MKSLRLPPPALSRQMNLFLDGRRLEGMGPAEREKIVSTLAHILMQAVGLRVEELDDDRH